MIRKVRKSDLNSLLELERLCFHDAWSKKDYEYEMYDNPYATIWVLQEDDKIIGYYDLWIIFEGSEVANIAVHPDYRKKGYGHMLMEHLEHQAINKGCETIGLEVRVSNSDAIKLYEDCGFSIINVKPGYYKDDGSYEDAYRMMKGV